MAFVYTCRLSGNVPKIQLSETFCTHFQKPDTHGLKILPWWTSLLVTFNFFLQVDSPNFLHHVLCSSRLIWTTSMTLWLSCGFIGQEAQARHHGLLWDHSRLNQSTAPWKGPACSLRFTVIISSCSTFRPPNGKDRLLYYSHEDALYLVISAHPAPSF